MKRAKAQQKDKPSKDHPPRASSTDPEARMMRMPDGGTRPAYNLELAADCDSRAIVGVATTNAGSDAGQDQPMRDQVEARADEAVAEQLLDGGFCRLESIERAAVEEVVISMPAPEPRKAGVDRYAPKPTDSAAVAEWRQRMGTDTAKGVYKQRSSTIETINGELKTYRGLVPLLGARAEESAVRSLVVGVGVQHHPLRSVLARGLTEPRGAESSPERDPEIQTTARGARHAGRAEAGTAKHSHVTHVLRNDDPETSLSLKTSRKSKKFSSSWRS